MKIILIAGIVIECILLILLTAFKKWTRKAFILIAALTAAGCLAAGALSARTQISQNEADQRGGLYIAARLIQDEKDPEALEALSAVKDDQTAEYHGRTVRALAYNLNGAHNTVQEYLSEGEISGEESQVLDASRLGQKVEEELTESVVQDTLSLIGASEAEVIQWETELKVRYLGFTLTEEEKADVNSRLTLVQDAVTDYRTEEAYNLMMENPGGDQDAIIISQMYVYGYNNRIMADTDEEYAHLWGDAAALQAELNLASLDRPEGEIYGDIQEETDLSEEEKKAKKDAADEYNKLQARYELAQEELTQEAIKRSINYMNSLDRTDGNTNTDAGRSLQLAQLYYRGHEHDKAREYLDKVFLSEFEDDSVWLGSEINAFRNAFIVYLSDYRDNECDILFDTLMDSLYQGVFRDYNDSGFKDFVYTYLKEKFGSLVIRKVTAGSFPEITLEVSSINPDAELIKDNLKLTDSGKEVADFTFDPVDTSNLSVAFVLDKSGSMSGNKIIDSKNAIKSCLAQLPDNIMASLIVFDNDSAVVNPLSNSKYSIMGNLDGIEAQGGTNIASGLSSAIDSLSASSGTLVVILLSDGQDSGESTARMGDILARAASMNIVVYTVGLPGCNESYLQNISTTTSGQFVMVENSAKLNQVYADIQSAMLHSYIITYQAEDPDLQDGRIAVVDDTTSYGEARRRYSLSSREETETPQEQQITEDTQKSDYYKQTGGSGERR